MEKLKPQQSTTANTPVSLGQTSTVRMKEASDEVDLNAFVPNRVAKDILGIMGDPLSKRDIPEPSNLTSFWNRVERALNGLNEDVDLSKLNS